MTEDEMVGSQWLDTDPMEMSLSKFQQMAKDREGSLACCNPWGHKESNMTGGLSNSNNNNNNNNDDVYEFWKGSVIRGPSMIRHFIRQK